MIRNYLVSASLDPVAVDIIEEDGYKFVVYRVQQANPVLLFYSTQIQSLEVHHSWVTNPLFATTFDDYDEAKKLAFSYRGKVGIYREINPLG